MMRTARRETCRPAGTERKDGDMPKKWLNRELSPQHLIVFGQKPAPPSIALRKMEREERI